MNRLADETSPYLRQHRDNPVDWYPWGAESFAAAEARNVPILLSVGYSACHWCHVMAHECFEDAEVAAKMNELFVNVKVDREERPDVDALYMDAVQALTGRGGWPMTVFMTPAREPFYGGTYFPKAAFMQLMDAIDDVYRNKPEDVTQNVTALTKALSTSADLRPKNDAPGLEVLNAGLQSLARAFDSEWGGFGQAPKFPTTSHLELMLRAYMTTAGDGPKRIIETTLDAMCSGGMYDHIGGGFARYSTDREWLVPHFEKMLYDQALLLGTYLKGLIVIGRPDWRLVVEETIEYVLTELRHPDGGFYSAEDADSLDADGNTVEGWFSTWTPDEVRAALPQIDSAVVETLIDWYGITDEGNFEGRSIPNRIAARGQLIRPPELDAAVKALRAARSQRPHPGLDDKVLTEWNALFLSSLAQAAAVFGRRDWLDAAIANAEFLLRELRADNGRWFRSWQVDGQPRARHMALAADHAALVDAFTRLAEASGEARWIAEAVRTADTMLDWFFDPEQGGLFTTAEDAEALVVRQKDLTDGATPSANSTAAVALFRLAALTGEQRYANQADRILQLLAAAVEKSPGQYSNALVATDLRRRGLTEVVVVGDRPDLVRLAQSVWRPDTVLAWGEPYDSPLWSDRAEGFGFVCRNYASELPQDTLQGFAEKLTGRKVTITGDRIVTEPAESTTSAPDE
ncbi:MAG: thioredoxin domain-containing protein [Acidobacteriota bacterium]